MKSVNLLAKLALKDAIKSKAPPTPFKTKKAPPADPMKADTASMDHELCCPTCGHTGPKADFEE